MIRTPQEILQDHGPAFLAQDVDKIAANFSEDAIFISPTGIKRGKAGVRQGFVDLFTDLPDARWDIKVQAFEGDIMLMTWAAESAANRADDGVDTLVFRDGLIHAQTVHYTLTPNNS